MDDQEYYKMMRNQYSHIIQTKKNTNFDFTRWNSHQGREDAQMLQEKKSSLLLENEKPDDIE